MGVPGGKKRIAIIAVSSVFLVAMVIGAVVGVVQYKKEVKHVGGVGDEDDDSTPGDINTSDSSKAIVAICQPTDYQQECEKSLEKEVGNDKDPKELARAGIQVAINKMDEAIRTTIIFKNQAKDPMIEQALSICKHLLNASMYDLKISYNKMGAIDLDKVDEYAEDVRVWLSGAVSHQDTCVEAFENTTGDIGKKMKEILEIPHERTSNALSMVTETTKALNSLNFKSNARRLLASSPPSNNNNNNKNNQQKQPGTKTDHPSWLTGRKLDLLKATPETLKPNVTVAQDGSGKFKTINEALKLVPKKSDDLFVIYVKEGVYKENVTIEGTMENVVMIGDGPTKTKISGNKSFTGGIKTMNTATVAVVGNFFVAKDIGFENTAGAEGHQAVALRVQSDFSIFYNCKIDGYQNTLYVQAYRNYFRDCNITGTVDFIFGDAVSLFQNCRMVVRKPKDGQACIVTAQGRTDKNEVTGIVIQNCTIGADPENKNNIKAYLGRPWKNYARTIIMQSQIDDVIQPEGYLPWDGAKFHMTSLFGEYNNTGSGADMSGRAKWPSIKKLDDKHAKAYSGGKWFESDKWIKPSGVPFDSGMMEA
ncbi:pectinesterase-like [Argentina anserina]|uniref:pectinesterase-like n=1 Tax=Argentina anserina TaxID=57926 RepID=UPI0021766E86|nr:pectinesterase-like [Potentilla anserina]